MKIKNILILLIFVPLLQACREEFLLTSINNEKLMVVDGFITNELGPYTIKLAQSAHANMPEFIPLSNCIVTLKDNTGISEVLSETIPGQYSTAVGGLQGIVGNEYQLSIITREGEEYETDFQQIKEPIGIDSVYAKLTYMNNLEYFYGLPGYDFFVNTKSAPEKENYFLWNMTEAFEYDIDYKLAYVETRFGDHIYQNPRYDTLQTCWNTEKVKFFYSAKTTNLSLPQISNKPLHFVSTQTKKLTKKYTVLISQYVIDEEAYYYWQNLENQISNENFLTTTQPYNIKGNVRNVNDSLEMVLGYFIVAPISQKRIFVDRPRVTFYYPTHFVLTDPVGISEYKRHHPPPYFWVTLPDGTVALSRRECIDCRSEGGELAKPDFWIDK